MLNFIKNILKEPDIQIFDEDTEKIKGIGFKHKDREFVHHSQLSHHETAYYRLSVWQKEAIFGIIATFLIALIINWHATLLIAIACLTFFYFADLLFNLFVICRSFTKAPEIKIGKDEIQTLADHELPKYTIFCPLYKEWQVIPQFISAMNNLSYPKEKLQIMLLLEEDDKQTIEEVGKMSLPLNVDVIVVPHSFPKTKPKALNYGLKYATGEFVVIYDAEDVPDPLQLKKVVLAFQDVDPRVVCIQAKLNFYNPHQNVLTRVFTAEYSLWFDLVLTGLQSVHAPIPLGGTSNHFKREDVKKLKGWDSFNVTEDADLGMRLIKQGYRTAIIDSDTHEEANSDLKNWFWQRTRWIKGYMQTYLVHMRRPRDFINQWREPHLLTFQLIIGGKILSMFINPFMWLITISYFAFRPIIGETIESFYPAPILYMGIFSLVVGNFLYLYYYMVGCSKREYHDLIKYVLLVPLYWLGMSVAAWVAAYLLIRKPHHWSKTKHGLHLSSEKGLSQSKTIIDKANVQISPEMAIG